jgi:hypothetical protein
MAEEEKCRAEKRYARHSKETEARDEVRDKGGAPKKAGHEAAATAGKEGHVSPVRHEMHERHAHERAVVHHRHQHELAGLHHQQANEHAAARGKGGKEHGEIHKRHLAARQGTHERHEGELKDLMAAHEKELSTASGPGAGAGEQAPVQAAQAAPAASEQGMPQPGAGAA